MSEKKRGFAVGEPEDVDFAICKSMDALRDIYAINGDNMAGQALFFNKKKERVGVVPCITCPVETNGRATMLAINSLTKDNADIEYVLFLSAVIFNGANKAGTVVHFETRSNPHLTTDLLFEQISGVPHVLEKEFYDSVFGQNPFASMPIYGFFDEPEFKIRNKERDIFKGDMGYSKSPKMAEKKLSKAYKNLRKYFLS